jgi:hypothetical protein
MVAALSTYTSVSSTSLVDAELLKYHFLKLKTSYNENSCGGSDERIIISYANEYHFPLILLQIYALRQSGVWECLRNEYALVGLDSAVVNNLCPKHGISNCMLGTRSRDFDASDFYENDYASIVYAKWEIVDAALDIFKYVFIFDADVAFLRNPWISITVGNYYTEMNDDDRGLPQEGLLFFKGGYQALPQLLTEAALSDCDVAHQMNSRATLSVNGGQLLFINSTATRAFVKAVRGRSTDTSKDDQEHMRDIFDKGLTDARECFLHPDRYIGHCLNPTEATLLDLVTYHAICSTGIDSKINILSTLLVYSNLVRTGVLTNGRIPYDGNQQMLTYHQQYVDTGTHPAIPTIDIPILLQRQQLGGEGGDDAHPISFRWHPYFADADLTTQVSIFCSKNLIEESSCEKLMAAAIDRARTQHISYNLGLDGSYPQPPHEQALLNHTEIGYNVDY